MDTSGLIGPLAVEQARVILARARDALLDLGDAITACQTAELGEVAAEVASLRLAAETTLVEVTREAVDRGCLVDTGATSAGAWLSQQSGDAVREREAHTIGTVATAVASPIHVPVREALRQRRFGAETARVILAEHHEIRSTLPWQMHDDMLEKLIDLGGRGFTTTELRRFRRELIAEYGAHGLLDKQQAALTRKRAMTTFTEGDDGMFYARLRLDPASHAVVAATLDALSAPKTGVDDAGDVVRDDRAPEQRRADAFVEICANFPGLTGAGMRHTTKAKVVLTLSYADLVSGTGCATTLTGESLAPGIAREMACDAGIIPLVLGSASEEIDVGREERLATAAQISALRHRDKGCTYPGCTRPPTWCKAHHIVHWCLGGPTDLTNLALLCQHHHSHVHRHGLAATVDDTGVHWHIPAHARGRAAA
ncbi:HNH endonuclease signature motif containing protein [Mobilicoccus caccae]|uniref:HNH nuclease domain-containing protein n=1 Tax=Mobilicoccus caccae TaxID=1859295 RepID=A0ABQ6IU69_9MICO|nr:HNH endonuclease signature motif containing protein [Mobilicoccus caccae]GMA41480.1 hypothetical protein GCM10025883_35250 [Mobilicoccus caccae]